MQRPCYQNHIDRMNRAGIQAQLVREFLSKGLRKASLEAISSELRKLETQATVLRDMHRELESESENVSRTREE